MPGTDPALAIAIVLDELPEFPHLPELPGRGVGADMAGRTACLLVDLPVETTPGGWKLAARPGRDQRRAAGLLEEDLDTLEAAAGDYAGPVKVQLCGPWTLAATLELRRSAEPALADPGAVADLVASLAEAAAAHAAGLRRRLPRASLVAQLDEPALPGVLAGSVPTVSGLRRLPAVEAETARAALAAVLVATGAPAVVHCCAPGVPFPLLRQSGAAAAAFDLTLLGAAATEELAEAADEGLDLFAGVIPAVPAAAGPAGGPSAPGGRSAGAAVTGDRDGPGRDDRRGAGPDPRRAAGAVIELARRIGLPDGVVSERVVVTPACGLAGASPERAVAVLRACRGAARLVPELIAEGDR
jgi:hypothetical protein